jgi:hypothetical protein
MDERMLRRVAKSLGITIEDMLVDGIRDLAVGPERIESCRRQGRVRTGAKRPRTTSLRETR